MTNRRTSWLVGSALLTSLVAFSFVSTSPTAIQAKGAAAFEAAQKNGETVRCPVELVRAEITTSLPDPWWQTPQEGRLAGTRVATIGGKKSLVCEYSVYGTRVGVMREYPSGATDCRSIPGGFRCR